jgi:Holliday junction resolvasome RuvABC ATP-dependent DNA helicase subunit
MEYTQKEKETIIKKYLDKYGIITSDEIIWKISAKVGSVPREIHNLCIKIRDFVITKSQEKRLTETLREDFLTHSQIEEGGMTPLHAKYLEILEKADRPIGIKAIAVQLWVNEKAVEEDIEPLLLKLGKIEKSGAGRILVD